MMLNDDEPLAWLADFFEATFDAAEEDERLRRDYPTLADAFSLRFALAESRLQFLRKIDAALRVGDGGAARDALCWLEFETQRLSLVERHLGELIVGKGASDVALARARAYRRHRRRREPHGFGGDASSGSDPLAD